MMKDIKELLKKKAKAGNFMDEKRKTAAHSVIDDMDSIAEEAMSKGMHKVTVAADSKEGLEKGLEKAEEVIDMSPEDAEMEGNMMEEKMEDDMMDSKEKMDEESYDDKPDSEYSDEDEDEMDDYELDEMIAMLKEKKARRAMTRDE